MSLNGSITQLSVGNGCNKCNARVNVKVLKCLHELCTSCLSESFDNYLICPICLHNTLVTSHEAIFSLPSAVVVDQSNEDEKCPAHPNRGLTHYCVSCQISVCQSCVQSEHSEMPHVVKRISETTDMFLRCLNVAYSDSLRIKSSLESSIRDCVTSPADDDVSSVRSAVMERYTQLSQALESALAETLVKIDSLERKSSSKLGVLETSLRESNRCLETFKLVFDHASDLQKITYSRLLAGKNEEIAKKEDCTNGCPLQFSHSCPSLAEYIKSNFGAVRASGETPQYPQRKGNPETFSDSYRNGWFQTPLNPDYYNLSGYEDSRFKRGGRLSTMEIVYKFGQLGLGQNCFSSPHGFCMGAVNGEEHIFIADTNNHRIQIYRIDGLFVHSFGVSGRGDGQIWYPRKVAYLKSTGCIVVCDRGSERSRMQIFTVEGSFVRKIIIRYIDIVAGLVVSSFSSGITRTDGGKFDSSEVIVAVDSVSPTVFIISEMGDLLRWFDCSDYMKEPSDIIVHNDLFYICDFKGHAVVVFNSKGKFVSRVGNENITNFPNGIDISVNGDILVGDSHGNRFHVAVFSMTGDVVTEFECPKVKVSRCCGLKITSQGYIVTLAKNNHHVLVLNRLFI